MNIFLRISYISNPDIKLDLTKNNVELIPLAEKNVRGFKLLVKNYEKEMTRE